MPDLVQRVVRCAPRYVPGLTVRTKQQLKQDGDLWYDVTTWSIKKLEKSVDCVEVLPFLAQHRVEAPAVVLADVKRRIAAGRTKLIEVLRKDCYTVRAKTALNAYDAASLRCAILKADCQGLDLRDVMMEYKEACRDLYAMSETVVEINGRVYFSEAAKAGPDPDTRELFGLSRAVTL